jgi:hypothetical protein
MNNLHLREIATPRRLPIVLFLICVHLCSSVANSFDAEVDDEADKEALRRAGLPTDGPDLLALFRRRTPDADSQARIKSLIAQLGSDSFTEREEASEELATCGVAAVGLLRAAAHHADLEIRRRAKDALAIVEENGPTTDALIAALHVLGRRKPAQLAEVLLAYAPHAVEADITEELCSTLASAAVRGRDADPTLVHALTDPSPIKRAVAGAALGRSGCLRQLPAVRCLLRDPDAQVRRCVALALLEARDKTAVRVLIELLAELPLVEAEHVESMLLQISSDMAPKGSLDADRGKYRDAWAEWWKQHGGGLDLAKIELSPQWRGYVLAVCMTTLRGRGIRANGSILELDALGRTRWQLKGLAYPVDAQVIDEHRVLVTEYRLGQVTERNHNGDILRRINAPPLPLEARRLANGNTLITTSSRVVEIDRNDKEVWAMNGNPFDTIAAACPLRGGEIGICYRSGEFTRVDRSGKERGSFRGIGRLFSPYGAHIQGLPNGHILVPQFYDNKVVELDKDGHEVWSATYARPICAQRLPNGRTLVASYGSNFFAELDKKGHEVKRQDCNGPLIFLSGR